MAAIDERARSLAVPDDRFRREGEDADDEDQGDVDADEGEPGDGEGEGGADEEAAPPRRPGEDSGAALSAGLVLGFLAYSAVIQLVRGGPDRLRGWAAAKLINQTYTPASGRPT